ncbi:hypothetical protein GV819_15945 [Pseudomonas sp. Fl5BN2]|uniref:hypothetical protein n=1 Tax=Pseudomonas sp. Fl5BN2 TaxID=2697652 RepID=UPI001378368F|nr:hypothetical protein [Pseudomonas sp. Fl5BN2]NBF03786.1 hypothetical protein [Pseudomonas sp. Fl5BN2]
MLCLLEDQRAVTCEGQDEAQRAAKEAAKEAAEGREKDRRNNFRKELFSDLEQIIATPDILIDHRYGSPFRGTGYRWKHLAEFIQRVKGMRDQSDAIAMLDRRIEKQSALLRDMQLNQRDIMKALQMGNPVE